MWQGGKIKRVQPPYEYKKNKKRKAATWAVAAGCTVGWAREMREAHNAKTLETFSKESTRAQTKAGKTKQCRM